MRFRKAAGWVSAGGFLVPMAIMGAAAWLVPDSFVGEGTDRVVFAGFFAYLCSLWMMTEFIHRPFSLR